MLRAVQWGLSLSVLLMGACTPSTPSPASTPSAAGTPSPGSSDRPELEPVATPPRPENPDGLGDACAGDTDCGWDDGCMPEKCVGAKYKAGDDVLCTESAPPPGECLCMNNRCAMRPSGPGTVAGKCLVKECGLDEASGECRVGTALKANRFSRDVGPMCRCDAEAGCVFEWLEPVACEDVSECWVSQDVPRHPIARPKKLKKKKFRPCKDGVLAPACQEGACTLRTYRC